MFARKVSMHLKSSVPEFTQLWKGKSFPCFENRRDSGRNHHLSHREEKEAFAISLWDQAEKRGKLQPRSLRRRAKALAKVIDGLLR